jgi:nifR3 family TIM-barrel protein
MDTPSVPTFFIRGIPIYGDAILAPMDGFSDWPFRSLCRELGSAMSYTEFIQARDVLNRPRCVREKLAFGPSERPVAFQLYGDDPDDIVEAAKRVRDLGPDTVDVNMGCPARSVVHHGAGVGMMRSPLKIARTFRKLTAALDLPVTGKIRLGWDDCRSYRLVARIVEENGGSLVAIHGRTKEQGYGGQANWDAIAEVKQSVKIPVIGNGDVRTVADIQRLKAYTGCEAVMIGRGAIGNPWIFSGLDRGQFPPEQVRHMIEQHLSRSLTFYGPRLGLELFRKHAVQYLEAFGLTREKRKELLTRSSVEEFLELLGQVSAGVKE